MWTAELIVVVAMVALNAVFAAYEIALASVADSRLWPLGAEGRHGAATAQAMKGELERSLAVVQLGITLVGVIARATSGAGAGEDLAPLFQAVGMSEGWAEFVALVVVINGASPMGPRTETHTVPLRMINPEPSALRCIAGEPHK